MKIEQEKPGAIRVDQIEPGTILERGGLYNLMLNDKAYCEEGACAVACLETGDVRYFPKEWLVYKIEGVLHIKNRINC